MMEPWERQPGETQRAYAAFGVYRDMGSSRSLTSAHRALRGQEGGKTGARKAPSYWQAWSARYAWQERVALYDAHRDRKAREGREAEHLKELDEFRKQEKQLASATIQSAIALLGKANARLQEIKPGDIPVAALPSVYRAAAAVAEAASNSKAQALAVEELIEALNVRERLST